MEVAWREIDATRRVQLAEQAYFYLSILEKITSCNKPEKSHLKSLPSFGSFFLFRFE